MPYTESTTESATESAKSTTDFIPDEFKNRKYRRLKPLKVKRNQLLDIPIMGIKDPRGPDNNIYAYLDDNGFLRIRIQKTNRCYQFLEVVDTPGFIEVVAK